MAISGEQIEQLYREGKYREVIAAAPESIRAAWAHYQLGELDEASRLATFRVFVTPDDDAIARSAHLLLAHIAERQGDLRKAEEYLRTVPTSRERDNLYITILIARRKRGIEIVAIDVVALVTEAVMRAPYEVVDGHIINNAAWLFHQARERDDVKKLLPILPGLTEMAIGIYDAVGAADNHRASVRYRAALIFEAAGWREGARTLIRQSRKIWRELNAREGGERFRQNLDGVEEVARRLNA